jgi:hypothetical protein
MWIGKVVEGDCSGLAWGITRASVQRMNGHQSTRCFISQDGSIRLHSILCNCGTGYYDPFYFVFLLEWYGSTGSSLIYIHPNLFPYNTHTHTDSFFLNIRQVAGEQDCRSLHRKHVCPVLGEDRSTYLMTANIFRFCASRSTVLTFTVGIRGKMWVTLWHFLSLKSHVQLVYLVGARSCDDFPWVAVLRTLHVGWARL